MVQQAFLLAVVIFVTFGGNWLFGQCMSDRPIVVGALAGLVLGDLKSGIIMGAVLEAVFMGAVNIGGTAPLSPAFATVLGVGFAIISGAGVEIATTLAIPLGVLGGMLESFMSIVLCAFAEPFDEWARQGNQKKFIVMHYAVWALRYLAFSVLVFIAILLGAAPVTAFVENVPDVIMNGLMTTGGLLPAVGFAMLLKMLWDGKLAIFYFLGFVLVAYLKLPLVALAVIGIVIAVATAFRDKELLDMRNSAVMAGTAGISDEEDFFS